MRLCKLTAAVVAIVLGAGLIAASPPAAAADTASAPPPFDAAARASELERIAALVDQHYVYADKATAIAAEVRGLKSDPELSGAADRMTWAAVLTRRLAAHDAHFSVIWAPGVVRSGAMASGGESSADADRQLAASNYGIDAVERLPGNIGYVRLSYFAQFDRTLTGDKTPPARRAAEAALALIQTTDAVIFDLRGNSGGSPDMIDLLLAPFFGDKPVLLNRFYQREGDHTVDFTTVANFQGVRRATAPVYVLTSGRTGSAAEEFAYDVQTQKRGVIVGETTYGAADPGGSFDAGDGFSVFISTGAAVNPVTGHNWEGVGVKPDVAVPAQDALARAQALALTAVLAKDASSAPTEARWTLERLSAAQAGVQVGRAADYVGDFSGRGVSLQGERLVYRRATMSPLAMLPLGDDAFALDVSPPLRLTFERDDAGKVAALVIASADGVKTRYARSADPTPRP
jgi:hypothetical protein